MKKFKVGDLVRLSDNLKEVMRLQEGHGGLTISMIRVSGLIPYVCDICRVVYMSLWSSGRRELERREV